MRRTEKQYKAIPLLAVGLVLIGAMVFLLQISRLSGFRQSIEFGVIFGMILGWAALFAGGLMMRKKSRHYGRVLFISGFSLGALLIQGMLLYQNLKAGMEDQAYMDITVMFLAFITYIFLFYAYAKLYKAKKEIQPSKADRVDKFRIRAWILVAILFAINLIVSPLCPLFPRPVQLIITFGLGGLIFASQLALVFGLVQNPAAPRVEEGEEQEG